MTERDVCTEDSYRSGYSWCGEPLAGAQRVFRNVDNLAQSLRNGSHLTPCPKCLQRIVAALERGR